MNKGKLICWLLAAFCLLTGCEKVVFEEDESSEATHGNIILNVAGYEAYKGGVRSTANLTDVCTRLHFVIYQDGKRKKTITQKKGDDNFGRVELSLDAGDYEVLILGHSCEGKSPAISDANNQIQFSNITDSGNGTGYSDTFFLYDYLTVGDEPQSHQYTLQRATAMFRLVTNDVKPANVKKFWFSYEGGSKALDFYTGLGASKSQAQIVTFDTPEDLDGQTLQFELFTFPRGEAGELKVEVRAFDDKGVLVYNRFFNNVPIERNVITQYTGTFFTGIEYEEEPETEKTPDTPDTPTPVTPENPETPQDSPACTFLVDTDWAETRNFTY